MAQTLHRYFDDLGRIMKELACTREDGSRVGADAAFDAAVGLLVERVAAGGAVLFVGNGGSAAIASHMAVDFFKVPGVRATAFNDGPMLTCMGNDYGYEQVFARPVELFARPGDVLVAISSSGKSKNILNAAIAARSRGCAVMTLSGFREDNPLRALGDWNFYVASNSYGFVEVIHSAICHALFDTFMEKRK